MSMSAYQIHRLWGGTVPILSTNLAEAGLVGAATFNSTLTQAAVEAFDNFTNAPSPSKREEDAAPGRGRRRTRTRTTSMIKTPDPIPPRASPLASDGAPCGQATTPNDDFFEFQRTRGYRLATPSISDCESALQLQEQHIAAAVGHYLHQFTTTTTLGNNDSSSCGMAKSIADELRTSGAGLSIDMWAAVQRGRGAYHADHVHEGAIVSGVYYSSCPLGCAPLVLRKPTTTQQPLDDAIDETANDKEECVEEQDDVIIQPREGQLVLFPPWVSHGVPGINTEKIMSAEEKKNVDLDLDLPRVSWAFNLTGRLASIGDPWSVTRPMAH